MAFIAVGAAYVATLPGVGDAEERVHRILALHHATYAGPQPAARLGDAVVAVEDEHFYANFLINIFDGAGRAVPVADGVEVHVEDPRLGSTIARAARSQQPDGHVHRRRGDAGAATVGLRGSSCRWAIALAARILDMYLNTVARAGTPLLG